MDTTKEEKRSWIKIFHLQGLSLRNIQSKLKEVLGDNVPSYGMIQKWCSKFRSGVTDVNDKAKGRPPKTATNDRVVKKVERVLDKDRRLTLEQIAQKVKVSTRSVARIIKNTLGLSLRCCRWVPRILTDEQKKKRKTACTETLALYHADSENFLGKVVTSDETYIHYFQPTTKRESSQWLKKGADPPVKAKLINSAKKVMALIFWDMYGVLLVKYFRKGATLTGKIYSETLKQLKEVYMKKRGVKKWRAGVYLLHDNASSHTSKVAQETIENLGFQQLNHPPYSPDLAPSDYYLFPKMKKFLRQRRFESDKQLEKSTSGWLSHQPSAFYEKGISALVTRCEKCIKVKGNYVEKTGCTSKNR